MPDTRPPITCPHCNFTWTPRVAHPVKCRKCQRELTDRFTAPVRKT